MMGIEVNMKEFDKEKDIKLIRLWAPDLQVVGYTRFVSRILIRIAYESSPSTENTAGLAHYLKMAEDDGVRTYRVDAFKTAIVGCDAAELHEIPELPAHAEKGRIIRLNTDDLSVVGFVVRYDDRNIKLSHVYRPRSLSFEDRFRDYRAEFTPGKRTFSLAAFKTFEIIDDLLKHQE